MVFTDIESSTRLLEKLGTEAYRDVLAIHREIVRQACGRHQGYEVDYEGDAFFYAFPSAKQAVIAVSEAMAGLAEGPIRIRVGIHTGEPELDPPKYVGLDVHLAARIMSAAHGGQILLSQQTRDELEAGFEVRDLGEHRLKDIAEPVPIFQLGEGAFPPLKTISNTNLPRPASSFVGREHELQEVLDKIEAGARLVTLTGPGGSGKTRLAIEAAATIVPEYKAGVFWVGLASLRDPALVTETIAQTLGAKDGLQEHIGERELLLLLDNLEQVIEAAPELSSLVTTCPNLTLLVTSRELLRVQGEVEYPVSPLASPEAVMLFCERAQTEPDEPIAELCARLDNLPLAVELAAARAKALSPAQILERLSQRLDLFRGGRDADPRQQTLRATIEWSYDLLAPKEQQLFRRLSVFAGGCTLEAAEKIADADLDTLQSLVEKSLLRFSASDTGSRYEMLETIREYTLEKLRESNDAAATPTWHTDYFVKLAERAYRLIQRPDQATWLDRLEREHDNFRAALARVRENGEGELELRLAEALSWFWIKRGYLTEGRLSLEHALAVGRDPKLRARALHEAGFMATNQGRHDEAEALLEEGWRLARQFDDVDLTAHLLLTLAGVVSDRDVAKAEALYRELLRFVEENGGEERFPDAFVNLADFALRRGDYTSAEEYSQKCLELQGEEGDASTKALALGNLGLALLGLGRQTEACERLAESLRLDASVGDKYGIASVLSTLAYVIALQGEFERAGHLLAKAELLLDEIEAELPVGLEGGLHERALARVRAEVDDFESVWSQGQAMSTQEAVAEALGQSSASPPASH
jgi:predicted ATPase